MCSLNPNVPPTANHSRRSSMMGSFTPEERRKRRFLKAVHHHSVEDALMDDNAVEILLHAVDLECVQVLHELLTVPKFKEHINHSSKSNRFAPEMTPLILASHRNNYELIDILLRSGASLIKFAPLPKHDVNTAHETLNMFRAIASPAYISCTSPQDPIMTALRTAADLMLWSQWEYEFSSEYVALSKRCEEFATVLLNLCYPPELQHILLNGPNSVHMEVIQSAVELGRKVFVASPNFQLVLTPIWYGLSTRLLERWRRLNIAIKWLMLPLLTLICMIQLPFASLSYIFFPWITINNVTIGDIIRIPMVRFINHTASQMTFLVLLILAASSGYRGFNTKNSLTLVPPNTTEYLIVLFIVGLSWNELKQMQNGFNLYFSDLWNRIDIVMIILYWATITLRTTSYIMFYSGSTVNANSRSWDYIDVLFLSEGLFAIANVFSFMRLVSLACLSQQIGPMQISLARMVCDVLKFLFIFFLVLLSFACGLHQLQWLYAAVCYTDHKNCRKHPFTSLMMTIRSLFWAIFNQSPFEIQIDDENEQQTSHIVDNVVEIMYAGYYITAVIVLLKMLVAMMKTSYSAIEACADIEWKFARSKLWLSYMDEGCTLPAPFNLIPTSKSFRKIILIFKGWREAHRHNQNVNAETDQQSRKKYRDIMADLLHRYRSETVRLFLSSPENFEECQEIRNEVGHIYSENQRLMALLHRLGREEGGAALCSRTAELNCTSINRPLSFNANLLRACPGFKTSVSDTSMDKGSRDGTLLSKNLTKSDSDLLHIEMKSPVKICRSSETCV